MAAPRRPNILLITSDQHRGDSYGFENPVIYTPHLDRLAAHVKEGVHAAGLLL